MGMRRTRHIGLPARLYFKQGRYYYGRAGVALGADKRAALIKYAELETGCTAPGTFADAVNAYREQELPSKATKTRDEYSRQLNTLVLVFGECPIDSIRPVHVARYLAERGAKVAGAREKALLSAVFNFARRIGLTDAVNPCAGIRAKKSQRKRYVTDGELAKAMSCTDPVLSGFLELCYLTGQRPSDVLRMRRQDVQDGALCVEQRKTGAKVRIEVVGPLEAVLKRLRGPVASVYLVHDARGQRLTLSAIRKRFKALGMDWQIRDLRAKAASDSTTALDAQRLLGHSAATTTDGYIRQRAGHRVSPIMRKIADKPE